MSLDLSMAIDLRPFCGDEGSAAAYLMSPWSRGVFTYATNGHVLVRVPRRPDVPEIDGGKALNTEAVLRAMPFADRARFTPLRLNLPAQGAFGCPHCGERINADEVALSVSMRGAIFRGDYIRLIMALPDLRCAPVTEATGPFAFIFSGDGIGALMPMRSGSVLNIEESKG
jgi:hypothetical protein